jgi:hypothetical protein
MPITEGLGPAGAVQVDIDATSGSQTYTLPASFAPGRKMLIRRKDSSGYTATVNVVTGGVLDGVTNGTRAVPANSEIKVDKYDGNVWETYGAAATDSPGTDVWLKLHAGGNLDALLVGAITRDADGAATSAGVIWPDGTTGTYTATTVSTAFPGAVDAYTVTYAASPARTVTQPAVTRDETTGAVVTRPGMTVS